jgi:type II secretory pathway pseudopilin PulG
MALVIGIAVAGLVVIAIVGILAAIAIPNFLTAMQRAKQKRTMADMRTIATALDAYGIDHSGEEYPPGTTVAELSSHLQPKYVGTLPARDGWEQGMRYAPLPGRGYAIVSSGADMAFEADSPDEYASGATSHFDCDIVFANGEFRQYPEGVQSGGGQ